MTVPSAWWGCFQALHQVAVPVLFGVDQLHIAVVRLGGGVHQVKDTLGACHGHDDAVGLLADLADGLGGVLV